MSQTGSAAAHYGASYLFMSYFLDRFGEDATKALVAHDANGLESVDLVLRDALNLDLTHEDIFADWVVANWVDDTSIDDGQYGYDDIDVGTCDRRLLYSEFLLPGDTPEHGGSVRC